MTRRTFLKASLATVAGLSGLKLLGRRRRRRAPKGYKQHGLKRGLAVAHGEDPRAMAKAAVTELGGMSKLVSPGDVVVIKPNMAWPQPPEHAANTNPPVVAALVEMCVAAGAREVKVFDHTCSADPRTAYEMSGIAAAATKAGAKVKYVDPRLFVERPIKDGRALESWVFYEEVLSADVLINAAIAKHHSTSRLSMALKNAFGMIGGNRGRLHPDIHTKIADINRALKVDLTVLDAYRILVANGPTGGRPQDVDNSRERARRVIVGVDPVAVDSYGATLFGLSGPEVGFIRESQRAGLGEMDLQKVAIHEIQV